MRFVTQPSRGTNQNYFPVPNEVFDLGLPAGAIAVYSYLLRCEDRETFQCWPSYRTIGGAVGMGRNTVMKYVSLLEEQQLIRTKPTMVTTRDGRIQNGNLLYTILPIRGAVEFHNQRLLSKLDATLERQRAEKRLAKMQNEVPCPA